MFSCRLGTTNCSSFNSGNTVLISANCLSKIFYTSLRSFLSICENLTTSALLVLIPVAYCNLFNDSEFS
nr:MAG TPA: hypothetical protein [Caudoviricetes sp.]